MQECRQGLAVQAAAGKKWKGFSSISKHHGQTFPFPYTNFYFLLFATRFKNWNNTEKRKHKKMEIEGLMHLNITESPAMCFESHLTTQSRRCGAL